MYQEKIGAYKQNDVLTADPKTLVVLCYNAAISNLKVAKARFTEQQYEAKAKAMQKALGVIGELLAALNFEKGGQIARNLNAIYAYMYRRISHADVQKDMHAIDEVIGLLEELRNAWKEISDGKTRQNSTTPRPAQKGAYRSMSVA